MCVWVCANALIFTRKVVELNLTLQHDDPFEALVRGTRAESLAAAPENDEQLLVSIVWGLKD